MANKIRSRFQEVLPVTMVNVNIDVPGLRIVMNANDQSPIEVKIVGEYDQQGYFDAIDFAIKSLQDLRDSNVV